MNWIEIFKRLLDLFIQNFLIYLRREKEREKERKEEKKEMKLKIKAINKQSMDRLIWLNDIYTNQIQLI
jgi:hypothetical protein